MWHSYRSHPGTRVLRLHKRGARSPPGDVSSGTNVTLMVRSRFVGEVGNALGSRASGPMQFVIRTRRPQRASERNGLGIIRAPGAPPLQLPGSRKDRAQLTAPGLHPLAAISETGYGHAGGERPGEARGPGLKAGSSWSRTYSTTVPLASSGGTSAGPSLIPEISPSTRRG